MRLVGDLGGTNLRLALWHRGRLGDIFHAPAQDFDGTRAALDHYLGRLSHRPDEACLAVAGPVIDGVCEETNSGWRVDGPALEEAFGLPFRVINDFHAAALGTLPLGTEDSVALDDLAVDAHGTRVVIGAGTGLGVALVHGSAVISGEGGHRGFSPHGPLQRALLDWLEPQLGRVSWEQVCSGPGIVRLHAFALTRAEGQPAATGAEVTERMDSEPAARLAMELFVDLYGSVAGDLALLALPNGGVWLGGGIAPRLIPLLEQRFRPAFENKAPREHLLRRISVRVVTHAWPGLLGAALAR